jgi:hypothetical protein
MDSGEFRSDSGQFQTFSGEFAHFSGLPFPAPSLLIYSTVILKNHQKRG